MSDDLIPVLLRTLPFGESIELDILPGMLIKEYELTAWYPETSDTVL
jgi:hypothetical protein